MTNATLKIYPNTDKLSKKDGTIPIYLRVMVNGKKAEAKIPNIKLNKNELSQWNPLIGCLNDSKSNVNIKLDLIRTNYNNLILKNQFEEKSLTVIFIRDYLVGKQSVQSNNYVMTYFKDYYNNIVIPSSKWSKSTKKIYNKSINHLLYFLNHKSLTKISIAEFDKPLGREFADYLTSTIERVKINDITVTKLALSPESASQVIKKIRPIFNIAEEAGLIQKNPLHGIKFKYISKSSKNLKIFEIKKLYSADLTHRPKLELCRDLFLFQVFTGMSYVDMVQLEPHQIVNITNDKKHFTYIRQKTKKEGTIILTKYIEQLIEKFNKHPYTKVQGKVVPVINICEYNSRLKILAEMFTLSLPDLASHIGRHCYRQFIDESEIVHNWTIHMMMGWSYEGNINKKYANGTEKLLLNASEQLENYFDEHLQDKKNDNQQLNIAV